LRVSFERVAEIVREKEPIIITVDRSGTLLAEAMWPFLDEKGVSVDTEKRLRLQVGREISDEFPIEEYEMTEFLPRDPFGVDLIPSYLDFLAINETVKTKIGELAEQLKGIEVGKSILVIDDADFQGITMGLTVPYVVLTALKRGGFSGRLAEESYGYEDLGGVVSAKLGLTEGGEVEVITRCLLSGEQRDWLSEIVKMTFPVLGEMRTDESRALGYLIKDLLRGSEETDEGELEPIITKKQIISLGEKKRKFVERVFRSSGEMRNPVELWKELYEDDGLHGLLSLNSVLVTKLKDLGRSG
jgi:hypothetical protein